MDVSGRSCQHPDIRKFDGLRCCLACGETVFEAPPPQRSVDRMPALPSPYEYANLNHQLGQEIRICVLVPGEPADSLRCEIIHVNLEDEPEYEAVSYTWASDNGDTSLSQSIDCGNAKHIAITVSCHAALQQLRSRVSRRWLWVDAISINQTNVSERSHQVGFMDRIYSQARSVCVCLQVDEAPPTLVGYKRMFHILQNGSVTEFENFNSWLFPLMRRILGFRYFERVWVIQEVALARVAYLYLNSEKFLLTHKVLDRLSVLAQRNDFQLPGMLRLRRDTSQLRLADITTCLRIGLDSRCTDARDQIYAVLSFMDPQQRSLIPVDYSLEVTQVYASAVVAIIATVGGLDILSYAKDVRSPPATRYLWRDRAFLTIGDLKEFLDVKQNRSLINSNTRLDQKPELLNASGSTQFEGDRVGPWRANIEVKVVDELPLVADLMVGQAGTPVVICRKLHHLESDNILPRFQVRGHFIDVVRRHEHVEYPLVREYFIDVGRKHEHVEYPLLSAYNSWLKPFFHRDPDSSSMATQPEIHNLPTDTTDDDKPWIDWVDMGFFVDRAKESPLYQCFSSHNSVGFAMPEFEEGDEIWALDGVRVPYILRKAAPKTYRVVSECYLWAALELDYWNPGTKKGRWRQEGTIPEEQTHIIEIF